MGPSADQRNRRPRRKNATPVEVRPEPELLTSEEIGRRYAGQWVLVRITAYDEHHIPIAGELLAHTPSHDEIYQAYDAAHADPKFAGASFYLYHAFELAPPGSNLRTICEEYWLHGDVEDEGWPATERYTRRADRAAAHAAARARSDQSR